VSLHWSCFENLANLRDFIGGEVYINGAYVFVKIFDLPCSELLSAHNTKTQPRVDLDEPGYWKDVVSLRHQPRERQLTDGTLLASGNLFNLLNYR
jgi:hypothetical protein